METSGILHQAVLIRNSWIATGVCRMTLSSPELAAAARPGQFVMTSVSDNADPFLRRPFSIADIDRDEGSISLIYQVVGKGTKQMADWKAGRAVGLLGPRGNGFSWDAGLRRAILVGGGLGVAALLPLAKELRSQGIGITAFAGARSQDLLIGVQEFSDWGCSVQVATEDGSGNGAKGFVTLPLEAHLKGKIAVDDEDAVLVKDEPLGSGITGSPGIIGRPGITGSPGITGKPGNLGSPGNPSSPGNSDSQDRLGRPPTGLMLFACGPALFLKAVADISERYHIETQLSLEERMGCGFGACIGCSIQTRSDNDKTLQKRVCTDGPVFAAREVVFNG